MKIKKLLFLIPLTILFVGIADNTKAQTVYVNSSTGNDLTGDGSSGNPYKTFHKGYTEVTNGNILNLTGIFDWTNSDEIGDQEDIGYPITKSITIQGQGADQTIIQAASTPNTADRMVFIIAPIGAIMFNKLCIRYGKGSEATVGGGIDITPGGNLTIANCYIHDNYADAGGGGISSYQSDLSIVNSTISNNTANSGEGGGILSDGDTFTITNSTICNNTAVGGGGIMLMRSSTASIITNCTISNNSAIGEGGGVLLAQQSLTIKNTIIANNTDGLMGNVDFTNVSGTVTDNGYNIVEVSVGQNWHSTGDIIGEQVFLNLSSTLAANKTTSGAPTLKLTSGSVAINAGSNSANGSVSIPSQDQRGANRNGAYDIGAYEYWNDAGALPVELTTFTARRTKNGIKLNWETATEVNNYGFDVERNIMDQESEDWETIGFVPGNGSSNSPKHYEFIDNSLVSGIHLYRLKQIDIDGSFEYINITAEVDASEITSINKETIPTKFNLDQNYPNPFNPNTIISYSLPKADNVKVSVYDILGNEIAVLVDEEQSAGNYTVEFAGGNLSSGLYIYNIKTNNYSDSQKMLLMK